MNLTRKAIIALAFVLSISLICEGMDLYSLIMDENYASSLIDCIIDAKPCDDAGEDIKALVLAVLLNDCKRCTPLQAKQGRKMMQYLQAHYPLEWLEVFHRYIY